MTIVGSARQATAKAINDRSAGCAKAEAGRLITRLGFAAIDLGRLADGGRLQQSPGGPLAGLNLIMV